jgi:hypothetical protein
VRKSIKSLGIAFKTTPPILWCVAVGSLVILVSKILVLDAMPEIFPHAHEFGVLAQDLLAATIAAFIFFVLSFQLPQVIERQRVGPSIMLLVDGAISSIIEFLSRVYRARTPDPEGRMLRHETVTLEMVTHLLNEVAPNDITGTMMDAATGQPATWLQAMLDLDERCLEYVAQVFLYSRFIDSDLAALLYDVQFSQYSRTLRTLLALRIPGSTLSSPNLGFIAPAYFANFQGARRLAQCCEKFRGTYC